MTDFATYTFLEMDAQDERARLARYKRAREAYGGEYPAALSNPNHAPDTEFNLARKLVNAGVSYLFGKEQGITISTDEASRERNAQEQYLDRVFAVNNLPLVLIKFGVNGGITGDPYLMLRQRSRLTGTLPRLLVRMPEYVTAYWDSDDVENIYKYVTQYPDIDRRTGKPIERRQTVEIQDSGRAWDIVDEVRPAGGKWQPDGPVEVWPWPFCPMLHCQNLPMPNEFYGLADLDGDALDSIESINFTLKNLDRIMENYGHPITAGIGLMSSIDRNPAKIIGLPAGGDIKMVQPQNVDQSSINFFNVKKDAFHEITELPQVTSGKLESAGQLSSLALKILYGPLIERTSRKRITYGAVLREMCKCLMAMGNVAEYGSIEPIIQWPEVLPNDPLTERQVLEADQRLGASKDSTLAKVGYDPQAEAMKREVENAAAVAQAQAMAPPQQPGQPFGGQ